LTKIVAPSALNEQLKPGCCRNAATLALISTGSNVRLSSGRAAFHALRRRSNSVTSASS
jgi:hypothetical protein